ncbi:glycosyltransferase family 4 protein [Enterococcus mediterraneensis]|uniref:glycosyltransferase family 4 protein n=1 Tax=Enterococcus mediterraneensis TaxID=2364791 RepID=UPI000F04B5E0|nr:glycosyltransferase family 4 protein [Enterococcus mediterraneensis]
MKRDVLFMCQFFYPEFVSSALLPYQTAKGLVESGISVDVLCGYPKEYSDSEKKISSMETIDGINIYRKKYLQLGRKNFISRLVNYFSFTLVMFLNLFKCRNYKVLIVYSNPPILPIISVLAKKFFGCKIVFVSYDLYPEIAVNSKILSNGSLISKTMRFINKKLFKNVSCVVSLSNDMKQFIVNNRNVPENQVTVIPNWATETFKEVEAIHNVELKKIKEEFPLIVSYFGNMGTAQDIETLLSVMNNEKIKNKKIAFIFAGHGNKKEQLKAFIQKNKLTNCFIFDYLKGNDFTEALNISNLFVVSLAHGISGLAVPSKTYSYYQAGKPVIAIMDENTDIALELKSYRAGISVKNEDEHGLVKLLLDINNDPSIIATMKKNITKLYEEKYKKDLQLKKYFNLINNLLEE